MVLMSKLFKFFILFLFITVNSSCNFASSESGSVSPTPTGINQQPDHSVTLVHPGETASITPTPTLVTNTLPSSSSQILRFAVIGDYGNGDTAEKGIAELIMSWKPDLIITTGDNNYPDGSASTIDQNIGQYFHSFIYPYLGIYGKGSTENRFFPSLGNHDWVTDQAHPYLDYFALPGNERYYQFSQGPVSFYAIDSDSQEPDGVNSSSIQANWLKQQLLNSSATWNIVYFHHPSYSSGKHGSTTWMRWPFKEWGVDLVLSGHDHTYERLQIDGLTYIVNGLGGAAIYDFNQILTGSLIRYNQDYGAMLIEASPENLKLQFINRSGEIIDDATLFANP